MQNFITATPNQRARLITQVQQQILNECTWIPGFTELDRERQLRLAIDSAGRFYQEATASWAKELGEIYMRKRPLSMIISADDLAQLKMAPPPALFIRDR